MPRKHKAHSSRFVWRPSCCRGVLLFPEPVYVGKPSLVSWHTTALIGAESCASSDMHIRDKALTGAVVPITVAFFTRVGGGCTSFLAPPHSSCFCGGFVLPSPLVCLLDRRNTYSGTTLREHGSGNLPVQPKISWNTPLTNSPLVATAASTHQARSLCVLDVMYTRATISPATVTR